MTRPIAPYVTGAIGGLAIAMAVLAFFGSFVALDTVTTTDGVAGFSAATASLGLLSFALGALSGLIIAAFAYVAGRAREPGAPRYGFGWLALVGMSLGGTMAFASVSLGVTVGGTNSLGTVTIPVTALVASVAAAGLITGAITTPVVDALARPAYFGSVSAATPVSSGQFWGDMARAIGVPTLSIAIGALLAIGLAELLLSTESAAVSVAAFSLVGALILGGTALFALRPWERNGAK
jgi:hypothetical protein